MENRRFVSFLIVSSLFVLVWINFVAPKLFPPPQRPVQQPAQEVGASAEADSAEQDDSDSPPPQFAELELPEFDGGITTLGSLDAESGYAMQVRIDAAGAAIEDVALSDPRYRSLRDTTEQAVILGTNATRDRTFSMAVDAIDRQLAEHGQSLETINWERQPQTGDANGQSVTYAFTALDGSLRVEKTYTLPLRTAASDGGYIPVDTDPSAYTLQIAVRVTNLTDEEQQLTYEIQGPVGVLLENDQHTSKYRDIKIEFVGDDSDVTVAASSVQDWVSDYTQEGVTEHDALQERMSEEHKWTGAFRYAGIDVQFFAVLIAPLDERSPDQRIADAWIDRTYPVLIAANEEIPRHSDISFRMQSRKITLQGGEANGKVEHRYAMFVGPKRKELLDPEPLAAVSVLNYGWFGFVARGMHWLLSSFHSLGLPYFMCIICLTVLVRGCLFPLSRKQAISAARMKELQPRIQELKAKFGDDREKLARAQMELWRKHKINPFSGCAPLVLQLPVFIGLYTALSSAVDLRLASFLWIENLAAPDHLFQLPFRIPYLGDYFNLLPVLTVFLFLAQQKLFMPPPVDEQTEAQYKMMNVMTLMFGFLFWHQAAGLCIYFIASSVWGIAERKLLGTGSVAPQERASEDENSDATVVVKKPASSAKDAGNGKESPRVPGFLQRLMDAAADAQQQAEKNQRQKHGQGKKKKKR